ncbi:LysR family transcriptional regulator [Roseovarius spongiae]|nr:LysR family transcriptional regulator [Roseovarius spongiae]
MSALQLSNLDVKQLRVFAAIVEHEGLSAAASALGVDLTAISRALSGLETRLGIRLCQRGRSGFALTAQGKAIYQQARRLIEELDEFETSARIVSQTVKGRLRIGLIDNTLSNPRSRVVQALQMVARTHSELFLELSVMPPATIEIALRERQLDVAVTAQPGFLSPLSYLPAFSERSGLYIARAHPDRARIEAAITEPGSDAQPIPFISRRYKMPTFDRLEQAYPFVPVASADGVETAATLIAAQFGVGVLPDHYAGLMTDFDLVELPVPTAPLMLTFYVVCRSDAAEEPTTRMFQRFLLGQARDKPPGAGADHIVAGRDK